MEKGIVFGNSFVSTWTPTNQLRWVSQTKTDGFTPYKHLILEQLWISDIGNQEWMEIPVVDK